MPLAKSRSSPLWGSVFTTMLGHKSSVRPMKKAAYEAGAKEAIATELCQGMTKRWAVGWTFRDDLNLRQNVKPTKQVRTDTQETGSAWWC